jgi:hypothetical protein
VVLVAVEISSKVLYVFPRLTRFIIGKFSAWCFIPICPECAGCSLFPPYVLLTSFGTFCRSHLMVEFQFGKSARRWIRLKPLKQIKLRWLRCSYVRTNQFPEYMASAVDCYRAAPWETALRPVPYTEAPYPWLPEASYSRSTISPYVRVS